MKNKILNITFIILILIGAFILRFLFLDKASGLWYDELISVNEAMRSSIVDIVKEVLGNNINFPLYQILLHIWIKVFGNSDIVLRLFSVIVGALTCFCAYFIGNKKQGLLCMSLFALNSFLIYYSQEVGLYSLLALFSILNMISLICIEQKSKVWAYVLWVLSSTLMVLTFTIAVFYILIQMIVYFIYKRDRSFIYSSFLFWVINLPFLVYVAILNWAKCKTFVLDFYIDYSNLFVVLQNFFTPKLVGLGINPADNISSFISTIDIYSIVFILVPLIIALYFIIKSTIRDNFNFDVFITAFLFVASLSLFCMLANIYILSRYLILLLPVLLILFVRGVDSSILSKILITVYIILNVFYLSIFNDAVFRLERDGYRQVAEFINSQARDGDYLFVWDRANILDKYLTKKFDKKGVLSDFTYKSEFILENNEKLSKMNLAEKKKFLRNYFKEERFPSNTMFLFSVISGSSVAGTKIFLVTNKFFEEYNYKRFLKEIENDFTYDAMTYDNLMILKSMIAVKQMSSVVFKLKNIKTFDDYIVYVYEK